MGQAPWKPQQRIALSLCPEGGSGAVGRENDIRGRFDGPTRAARQPWAGIATSVVGLTAHGARVGRSLPLGVNAERKGVVPGDV